MPFSLVHFSLSPLVRLIEVFSRLLLRMSGGQTFKGLLFANRRELREVMEESAAGFTTEEKRLINRVLDLQNISVRQVARSFGEFPVITPQTSVESVLKIAGEHPGSFWPVWHVELGGRRLAGLLDVKSLLFDSERHKEKRVSSLVASALFLDEDMTLEDALVRLQRAGRRLGVVLSKDKKEVGVVGTEDIFQVIFGKVRF
jgi:CBS domain containing-hemolysin-like protein